MTDDLAAQAELQRMTRTLAAGGLALGAAAFALPRLSARVFGFPKEHINDSAIALGRLYAIREAMRGVILLGELRSHGRPRPATVAWNLGIDAADAVTFAAVAARVPSTRRASVSIAVFAAAITTQWARLLRRARAAAG